MSRGRVTVPDVLVWLLAVAFLGGLYPVYSSIISVHIGAAPEGPAIILQTIFPLMTLILITTIYMKAGLGPR